MRYLNNINNYSKLLVFFSIGFFLTSCDPWDETADVSIESYYPVFEIVGDEFQSFIVQDSGEYTDPGALAYSDTEELDVYSYGDVDLTEVGAYTITYYAVNKEGLRATAERIIAVTNEDVTGNDLSGRYSGTNWDPQVEMKVTIIDSAGLYKCTDVMGYYGSEMTGKFVDLGNNELFLIHGDGDFGEYDDSEGDYTLSTLYWTISLTESPYAGVEVSVTWQRVTD